MMEEKVHIITERVFGSSRKIQFIGLEQVPATPTNTTTTTANNNTENTTTRRRHVHTPLDSLLSAIDHINSPNNETIVPSKESSTTTSSSSSSSSSSSGNSSHGGSSHSSMSIESLLTAESQDFHNSNYQHHRQSQSASTHEISVSSLLTSDNNTNNQKRKYIGSSSSNFKKMKQKEKTTITCLHASVAQKSYGSEKRFLCPPPIVQFKSPSHISHEQRAEKMQLSMSVICENGDKVLEQRSMLDENQSGSFKYLHVTGTAKAKQFNLKVDILPIQPAHASPNAQPNSMCSFVSKPISIISKPSKKTAKTRNVSTCILANSPVSLFNRINSQTVRTKYMTSCNNMLCAKNTTWSPFDIIIVNQPKLPQPNHKLNTNVKHHVHHGRFTSRIQLQTNHHPAVQQQNKAPVHVTYGTEIVLRDSQTGVTSPSLIIRKVDKGRIAQCAYGPVSQMQKVALQLATTLDSQPIYLSAAGAIADNSIHESSSSNSNNSNTWLDYSPSRLVQPENMPLDASYEEVDDYLCWTIVGINQFEYEYDETAHYEDFSAQESKPVVQHTPPPSPPRHITPYPLLTQIEYSVQDHTLNVIGQHLIQAAPVPRLLDLWLGTHGPLVTKISQAPQPHLPHETHWSVQLPPTQDLLVSNHDLLVTHSDGHRTLELNLLLVRQDGLVYHTGKALSCDILNDAGRWTVVAASSSS